MKQLVTAAVAAIFGMVLCASPVQAADQAWTFVTIGTGDVTGLYFDAGGMIARLTNKGRKVHHIRCSIKSTGGSVDNINAITSGKLDMGFAQSDRQYHAWHGTGKFAGKGPNKSLRAVFSLYAEPFTVVARSDAGITHFRDLKGKRVNIGAPGSGTRGTMETVMKAFGWTIADFKLASHLPRAAQSDALCNNKVDSAVFTIGHPCDAIRNAITSCGCVLVGIDGPAIDQLVSGHGYYEHITIPGGIYRGIDTDTRTFGVTATLLTSSRVDEKIIYEVVKAVFENLDQVRNASRAFNGMTKAEMTTVGLTAPLHEGAVRYYKEAGLM